MAVTIVCSTYDNIIANCTLLSLELVYKNDVHFSLMSLLVTFPNLGVERTAPIENHTNTLGQTHYR